MGNLIVRSRYNKVHEYFISDRETDGGIVKPEFFHDSDLWHPYPPLITPSPVNAELLAALKDFAEIAAQAKPNCGPKLRAIIQIAQEKHREVLDNV
jgi:hypothetical protein